MSNKFDLSRRQRLSELQGVQGQTYAHMRKEELLAMKHEVIQSPQELENMLVSMAEEMIDELKVSYQEWSKPFNSTRYCYSPNQRNRMLLTEIQKFVMQLADWLLQKGFSEVSCRHKCQEVVDYITDVLRSDGVPIGHLVLSLAKRRN